MIASVARDSGRSVASVGADSYALTLWAFLHGKDAQHIESLVREAESIDLAEMVTRGFIGGTSEIQTFRMALRAKLTAARPKSLAEIQQAADDLEDLHNKRARIRNRSSGKLG